MATTIITKDNFQSEVLDQQGTVLIDFWAEWCGPCRSMLPIVEKISNEYEGKALIGKINVDDYPEIGTQYGVRNIPFFLFFKDGQVANKHVGTIKESDFKAKIDALL